MIPKRAVLFLAGLVATLSSTSSAGIEDFLEKILQGEIRVELNVTDEAGQPLDGATVWILADNRRRQDIRVRDMARFAKRFYRDVDFVFEGSLHEDMLIERTGANGRAQLVLDDRDTGSLDSVNLNFAVIKRGYAPEVLARKIKKGHSEKIVVRMHREESWVSDPRLQQLDHLRALAEADARSDEFMSPEREALLANLVVKLRTLAETLEREKLSDEAAAVYYNLAYLPSVTLQVNSASGVSVREYTNGFNDSSPQRVADRAHAWRLTPTRPALQYERVLMSYFDQGLRGPITPARAELRKRYLADTEHFFSQFPEQIWPPYHVAVWQIYAEEDNFDRACRALRSFFEFEPSYYSVAGWQRQLRSFDGYIAITPGNGAKRCELPGIEHRAAS